MCECERCHKKFDWQYLLDKHLARKFPCKSPYAQIRTSDAQIRTSDAQIRTSGAQIRTSDAQIRTYNCIYCNKDCKRSNNRSRHELTCILKDDYVRNMEIKLDIECCGYSSTTCRFCNKDYSKLSRHQLVCKAKEDYKEKLEKQLEERKPVATTMNITNNMNNIDHSTNITNYITVNPFGKENMDYLTRAVILKLCKKANFRNEIIPRLVKQVHFNPEHPENHNILMTNLRAGYGKVYNGEDYVIETVKDIVDKVMDNVTDTLTTAAYMDNEDGKFNPYERAITRLEEDMGDEDSKFKREQRTKVKRNMYNNQRLIEKTVRKV